MLFVLQLNTESITRVGKNSNSHQNKIYIRFHAIKYAVKLVVLPGTKGSLEHRVVQTNEARKSKQNKATADD